MGSALHLTPITRINHPNNVDCELVVRTSMLCDCVNLALDRIRLNVKKQLHLPRSNSRSPEEDWRPKELNNESKVVEPAVHNGPETDNFWKKYSGRSMDLKSRQLAQNFGSYTMKKPGSSQEPNFHDQV